MNHSLCGTRAMRSLLAVATAGTLAMGTAAVAAPDSLTVTTGHPPVFMWTKMVDEVFLPEINRGLEEAGLDPIDFNTAYGTVAKPGTELQTIGDGVSDMGYVPTLFHAGELPLQNVSYMIPFGAEDLGAVIEVGDGLTSSIPAMRDAFERFDQVPLAGAAVDTYHLFTNFPVNSLADLEGRKIAAPGPAANWLQGTGAVPVASNLNEYYNNLKLGVYDGVLVFTTAAAAGKLHEVAPYVTLANFGAQYVGALTVNTDVWDDLSDEEQTIFREAAGKWRDAFIEGQRARAVGALEGIRASGATVTELSAADREAWAAAMPDVPGDWARTMEEAGLPGIEVVNGYVAGLRDRGIEGPRDWTIAE